MTTAATSPRRRVPALVAALALLVAACGDDDDASDQATAETTSETDGSESDAEPTTTASTSTVPDAEAEAPPGESGGAEEGRDEPPVWVADLSGDTEVPGPGDPDATGRVEIETGGEGELCIDMEATGLDSAVADAHIHDGAAGSSGPPVIPIGKPTSTDGDTDTWTDVCLQVDAAVLDRMVREPDAFYANVHTERFGAGAIRGQLTPATIFDLVLS